MPKTAKPVDVDTALQEVMTFMESPPEPGSADDEIFGERLRQVIAASIPNEPETEDDEIEAPDLAIGADLRGRLEDAARRRAGAHPFGEHPDGIGPTLGMDVGKS